MDVQLEPKLLRLVAAFEEDMSKAISEALTLWLKEKVPICPITESFCENLEGSCNDCTVARST